MIIGGYDFFAPVICVGLYDKIWRLASQSQIGTRVEVVHTDFGDGSSFFMR